MSIVSKELNYSSKNVERGTYNISRVSQQTGLSTVTLDASGGNSSVFEIPAKVINLSKSYLSFTLTVPALATKFTKAWVLGTPMIRSLQLQTREGLFLCDISDCHKYMASIVPYFPESDVLAEDTPGNGAFSTSGFSPNDGTAGSRITPPSAYDGNDRNASSDAYSQLTHIVNGAAANTAVAVKWKIPLSVFKNTILSMDLDQYFGGNSVFLNVIWNSRAFCGFTGDAAATIAAPVALVADCTITNLNFNMAIETNPVAQAVSKAPKSYNIDYVFTNSLALATAGLQSIQVRYTRAQGSKLKKVIYAPYITADTTIHAFNHNNAAGDAVTSFHSQINNSRIQQFNPVCASLEDYDMQAHLIKGTAKQRSNAFYRHFSIIDDFTAGTIPHEDSYISDGFDLSQEDAIYNMNPVMTGNTSYKHYMFAVTERLLTLGADGMVTLS